MKHCVIGIDLSINSTGICVIEENHKPIYYNIVPKLTRKLSKCAFKRAIFKSYEKDVLDINLKKICAIIKDIIIQYKPKIVSFESPAFSAVGRVVDLSMLCGYIKAVCDFCNVKYICTPPTTIKKFAVANGAADKQIMIDAWKRLDEEAFEELKDLKIDDFADAFFMAMYAENEINKYIL